MGLTLEFQRVADRLEESLLEDAENGFRIVHVRNPVESHTIVIEQNRLRIVAVKKPKQKFIDIEPDDRRGAAERSDAAFELGAGQGRELTPSTP